MYSKWVHKQTRKVKMKSYGTLALYLILKNDACANDDYYFSAPQIKGTALYLDRLPSTVCRSWMEERSVVIRWTSRVVSCQFNLAAPTSSLIKTIASQDKATMSEYKTVLQCTEELEIALESDRAILNFLDREGFIRPSIYEDVSNPKSLLSASEEAGLLVTGIKHKVRLNPKNYHKLMRHFHQDRRIMEILQISWKRNIASREVCLKRFSLQLKVFLALWDL